MSTVDSAIEAESVPGRAGYWVSLIAGVLGVVLSVELTKLHFALERDPAHQSYCNINQTLNCDAVATSIYSVWLGIPLSVWGIFAYSAAIVLALWGLRSRRLAPSFLLLVLGGLCTLGALALATLSAFAIGSWCLLCAVTWVVDATLFVSGWFLVRRSSWRACTEDVLGYVKGHAMWVTTLLLAAALSLGLTARVLAQKTKGESLRTASGAAPSSSNSAPKTGLNAAGHPTIGAANAKVVIEEFSDYQCPFCSKAHAQLRALVQRYPDAIQVVHRHFPLDNDCNPVIKRPFHTHACYYAKLAVCAATLNRFWQANDYLFHHGHDGAPVAVETLAKEIGVEGDALRQCLSSRATELLKTDIEEGIRLKIDGTPTFIINGEKATGPLPESLLEQYPL